jgi:DNA-binding IclR family transcriptional regulator
MRTWGFLTNHAHVLIQITRNPRATVREVALATGITERATHAVLKDLREAAIVVARRDGRQNVYQIDPVALAQHPRWAASAMEIPKPLVEATLRGLARVAAGDAPPPQQPAASA